MEGGSEVSECPVRPSCANSTSQMSLSMVPMGRQFMHGPCLYPPEDMSDSATAITSEFLDAETMFDCSRLRLERGKGADLVVGGRWAWRRPATSFRSDVIGPPGEGRRNANPVAGSRGAPVKYQAADDLPREYSVPAGAPNFGASDCTRAARFQENRHALSTERSFRTALDCRIHGAWRLWGRAARGVSAGDGYK
jgi:hypothetical protein